VKAKGISLRLKFPTSNSYVSEIKPAIKIPSAVLTTGSGNILLFSFCHPPNVLHLLQNIELNVKLNLLQLPI